MQIFLQTNVSYIDSSRRVCLGRWSKDVYHCRARYCVWHGGFCCLWNYLLDNNIILIVGNAFMHSKNGTDKSVPYIKRLDQIGQAFYILYVLFLDIYSVGVRLFKCFSLCCVSLLEFHLCEL